MGISLIERDCGKVAVPLKMKGLVEMPDVANFFQAEMAGGGMTLSALRPPASWLGLTYRRSLFAGVALLTGACFARLWRFAYRVLLVERDGATHM